MSWLLLRVYLRKTKLKCLENSNITGIGNGTMVTFSGLKSSKMIIRYSICVCKLFMITMNCPISYFNLPNGWSKNQHLTGCGVFSDPKCQWVLHMTKPQLYNGKCNQPITKIWTILLLWGPKRPHNLLGRLKDLSATSKSRENTDHGAKVQVLLGLSRPQMPQWLLHALWESRFG